MLDAAVGQVRDRRLPRVLRRAPYGSPMASARLTPGAIMLAGYALAFSERLELGGLVGIALVVAGIVYLSGSV